MTKTIKTTHMGSLPRPPELRRMLMDQQRGFPVDPSLFEEHVRQAVLAAVKMQVELGIDIISDGEQGRPDFMSYLVLSRLTSEQQGDQSLRLLRKMCKETSMTTKKE